jgi:hypothetical protein
MTGSLIASPSIRRKQARYLGLPERPWAVSALVTVNRVGTVIFLGLAI